MESRNSSQRFREGMDTWLTLLASGEPGEEEARVRRFDGEYRWFLFRAVPVRDEQGKLVRWYGTNNDIEDLKKLKKSYGKPATCELSSTRFPRWLGALCQTRPLISSVGVGWTTTVSLCRKQRAGDIRTLPKELLRRAARRSGKSER